jgi:long-chain fatty acid transport protein
MTPLPEMLMSADVRYIFYENTPGFKVDGDDAGAPVTDGAVQGFGWKNTLVLAFGLQYELSERVFLRGGYNYAGKAIEDELQGINVQLPQVINHHASLGLGYRPSRRFEISAGYYHGFKRSQTGPWILPDGAPDVAAVTNTLSENSFQLQFTMATRGL